MNGYVQVYVDDIIDALGSDDQLELHNELGDKIN